ncbi:MAG: hypothetical protein V4649_16885 [Bacteroidota bacterium]
MNKLIFPFVILAAFLLGGCSEKFDVAAPYKDITVVYGFLRQSDTAHYVRIQKAFLDQNKSAITMAKTADSNFYANLNVKIKRFRVFGSNTFVDTIHMDRVDLAAEGYPKQPGIFFDAPNYAYKFKGTLDKQYFYRIVVTNLTTGNVDSADAPIIDESVASFKSEILDDIQVNVLGLNFFSVQANRTVSIDGSYNAGTDYQFQGQRSAAGVAQLILRFNWVDSNINTGDKTPRFSDYDAGYQAMPTNAFNFKIGNTNLYVALRAGMGDAPANIIRLLDRCDLFLYLSTPDFYTYQQVVANQGTGLTGSEIQPTYTNIKGKNTMGLFASKAVKSGKVTITPRTVDSLMASPLLTGSAIRGTIY